MSRTRRTMSNGFATLLIGGLFTVVGCDTDELAETGDTGTLEVESIAPTFFRYLQGHFDSADQAATNPSYYAIELSMCEVEAPELGAMALYVEQALAGDEPYRQRIYVIEDGAQADVQARSVMYELSYPTSWSGFCDGESTATGVVTPDYVSELVGCDVTVEWDGERFSGGTVEGACLNDWGGATYATSEVMLAADRLESWDRGWDADGGYVWGATAGPYEFVRRSELVAE